MLEEFIVCIKHFEPVTLLDMYNLSTWPEKHFQEYQKKSHLEELPWELCILNRTDYAHCNASAVYQDRLEVACQAKPEKHIGVLKQPYAGERPVPTR